MPLDPHESPPQLLREVFKRYQRLSLDNIATDSEILDLAGDLNCPDRPGVRCLGFITAEARELAGASSDHITLSDVPIYEHHALPGLHVVPCLVPESSQFELASRLLHGQLSQAQHLTNLHKHYRIPYQLTEPSCERAFNSDQIQSFFHAMPDRRDALLPLDPTVHRSISMTQFLNRKLRWVTLGGQYDWTQKMYPSEEPPPFPSDLAKYVQGMFPQINPEAAIVNLYSPGDTLSLHRDVSEESSAGLVSISLGCDALFLAGLMDADEAEPRFLVLRLRSGDGIWMSDSARYAWHGVPRILPSTCPQTLASWPAEAMGKDGKLEENSFEQWRGWMQNKRINLNIRQMKP